MPTYEYICKSCQHTWETVQKITEDPVEKCPKCEEPTAERLISSRGAFTLNGPCWARDGYG